jgi:hypothetical protein
MGGSPGPNLNMAHLPQIGSCDQKRISAFSCFPVTKVYFGVENQVV